MDLASSLNSTEFLSDFSHFLQSTQVQLVNRAQDLSNIKPGYRAIVKWIKARMIKEIYARIQAQVANPIEASAWWSFSIFGTQFLIYIFLLD